MIVSIIQYKCDRVFETSFLIFLRRVFQAKVLYVLFEIIAEYLPVVTDNIFGCFV